MILRIEFLNLSMRFEPVEVEHNCFIKIPNYTSIHALSFTPSFKPLKKRVKASNHGSKLEAKNAWILL